MALTEGEPLEGPNGASGMTLKRFILKQRSLLGVIATGVLFLVIGAVMDDTVGGILGAYGLILISLGFLGYVVMAIVRHRLNS